MGTILFFVLFFEKIAFFGLQSLAEKAPETQGFLLSSVLGFGSFFGVHLPQIHYQRVCFWLSKSTKMRGWRRKRAPSLLFLSSWDCFVTC